MNAGERFHNRETQRTGVIREPGAVLEHVRARAIKFPERGGGGWHGLLQTPSAADIAEGDYGHRPLLNLVYFRYKRSLVANVRRHLPLKDFKITIDLWSLLGTVRPIGNAPVLKFKAKVR